MKKEINEFANYIKENFSLLLVLIIILTPTIWKLSGMYYDGRIEGYKQQIENLKQQNEISEAKKKEFKAIVLSSQEHVSDWSNIESKPN